MAALFVCAPRAVLSSRYLLGWAAGGVLGT